MTTSQIFGVLMSACVIVNSINAGRALRDGDRWWATGLVVIAVFCSFLAARDWGAP